jgi:hypothetical protein
MVKLRSNNVSETSSFSKVQSLVLYGRSSLTDISPFKDIPYLQLQCLPNVNFSCLGNQRFLMISQCPGLSSEDVRGFGNVFHLWIFKCHSLKDVSTSKGRSKFLIVDCCSGLESVTLSESDYFQVRILKCNSLGNFRIQGTVYSLDFPLNARWTIDRIPRKYQY